jgi:hypothetical protein
MKIPKYYVIFVYIFQGKMGKMKNPRKNPGKTREKNHATKVTKILKTERQAYGMN